MERLRKCIDPLHLLTEVIHHFLTQYPFLILQQGEFLVGFDFSTADNTACMVDAIKVFTLVLGIKFVLFDFPNA